MIACWSALRRASRARCRSGTATRPGRPIEFGRRIGALMRELREMPRSAAIAQLTREHDLDEQAAENVLRYLADQELATRAGAGRSHDRDRARAR